MHRITPIMLVVVGIIHLIPVSGLLGADHLARLYGIAIEDPNLIILMRHRALSIALLGILMLVAAWDARLCLIACCLGLASTVSFIALSCGAPAVSPFITRVVAADVFATICLLVAVAMHYAALNQARR